MPRFSLSVPDIEHEKSRKWREVPRPSEDTLRNRMVQMYWIGVYRDVRLLIRTLRSWQHSQYEQVDDEDEVLRPEDVKGFNTFVERAVGKGRANRVRQTAIRQTVRDMERNTRVLSRDQRRARMLLQGAGFLDISKLMEHREPPGKGLWSRPRAAQLALGHYDQTSHMPSFRPLVCAHCSLVIRGTQFRCAYGCHQPSRNLPSDEPLVYCETCVRAGGHYKTHLRKFEKRCILREVVSPTRSRRICTCENLRHSECSEESSDGEVGTGALHFAVGGGRPHVDGCPVLKLKRRHEHAKIQELRRNTEFARSSEPQTTGGRSFSRATPPRGQQVKRRDSGSTNARNHAVGRVARSVPPPIEFGNVHMMLMVGAIIIENGVPDSMGGVRISIREPPQFTMVTSDREGADHLMCLSPKRKIFQMLGAESKRRIRACMKQVVGGIFTGLSDDHGSRELEWDIINSLVDGSRRCAVDPMKTQHFQDARLATTAQQIVDKLRVLIGDRVTRYFDVFARKLFTVELAYNMVTNHCQRFCAAILDFRAFGSFLATTPSCRIHVPTNPLYLISFVCPPGSYDSPRPIRPKTKALAPNGLTEEYILRFRQYGHHEESDMADKLMEYWQDWGNFGGPLYKHQSLFPWDCTEAYRRERDGGEGKCNSCSIAKHVWSFPFDAWSMVQLHINRERLLYSPPRRKERTLSDAEWMRNRLAVLAALGALNTVAVAMARTVSFRATCRWNRERKAATPDVASKLDRIKLSGIHRAQPRSHFFEQGKYHDCTLAEWALLSREGQIKEYEKLRDHRADVLDEIPRRPKPRRRQSRLPRSNNNSRPDPDALDGDRHRRNGHGSYGDEDRDTATDEPTDIDEDEYEEYVEDIEEAGFEAGGGLLPYTFGADPPSDYDDGLNHRHGDGEAEPSLLPSSFGPGGDSRCGHNLGTGSCDYDADKGWFDDLPDRAFEDCRRSIGDSSRESDRYPPPSSPVDEYRRENGRLSTRRSGEESGIASLLESPSGVDGDRRVLQILENLSRETPLSLINPMDISPDTDWYTLYRASRVDVPSFSGLSGWTSGNSYDNNDSNSNYDSLLSSWNRNGNNDYGDFFGGGGGSWGNSGSGNNYYDGGFFGSGGGTWGNSGSGNNDSDDGCGVM
ncbi:MAG: hypothetical protein M1839_001240 [Geoglossum umbratile]|nr:MAG: hypothetical protein M1839_001240 [Geoglossum umbratile]